MKLTNTYLSKDCTRKVFMYVDKNGHYFIKRYSSTPIKNTAPWMYLPIGKDKFKHIESAQRAISKWIKK